MAAGFSLPEENIEPLRRALNENTTLSDADLIPKIVIDVPMPVDYVCEDLVKDLELLEPFGKGNEKPVFADRNLCIESLRIFGKEGRVIRMRLRSQAGKAVDAIYFGDSLNLWLSIEEKYGKVVADDTLAGNCSHRVSLHFTYYPVIDDYYEQPRLQMRITGVSA